MTFRAALAASISLVALVVFALFALTPVSVEDGTVNEAAWQCLTDHGFHGDANDGVEALYAPPVATAGCIAVS